MKKTFFILCVSILPLFSLSTAAFAEWSAGVGTGLARNYVDVKQGFDTRNDAIGSIKMDVKLEPEDFDEYMETAYGFGGFVMKDMFLIQYSMGYVVLGAESSVTVHTPIPTTVKNDVSFTTISGEATVGVPVYKAQYLILFVDAGARYLRQELDIEIDATGGVNKSYDRNVDNQWVDPLLGITFRIPFTETLYLHNRLNAGYFGSDGTYTATSTLTWQCFKHLAVGLNGKYVRVKYENESRGDKDWYLYDGTESAVGINFLILF